MLHRLQRFAFTRGLSNQRWLTFGIAVWAIRRLRKMAGRQEHVVYREVLDPGQTLVIAHERAPVDL
jgi:hypothetical protein